MPRSGLLVDGRRAGDGERGDHGKVFGVALLSKKLFQTSPGASRFGFRTFLFPLFTLLRYEKNMRIVGLKDLSTCLILAGWSCSWRIARKARRSQTFRGFGYRGGFGGRLRRASMVLANRFPNSLSFLPDSVLHPRFGNISCGFIFYHRKEFQYFRCLQSSRVLGMSTENSTRLLVARGAGLLVDGCKRIWVRARRAARGGCGSSMARGSSGTCSPKSSGNVMSTRLPKCWCCAACEPCWGSGDCRCGSRQMISILSVFHVLGRGHLEREFHKEFILNCTMCGILESIYQVRAPPAHWAELEVPLGVAVRDGDVLLADDREVNKAWCVDRQELFLYLTSQLLQDKHTWTFQPGLQERDVCTLLLTKSILGLPNWIRAGYQGVGDVRPAYLFPLVKSKCFSDSGVRKAGHSCGRRVIVCSSVPHKMAWRSVARAIRTVARLGGLVCEIFDISQQRCELDSMFLDLDTPPSRCCWRCGCAMSCGCLITADMD